MSYIVRSPDHRYTFEGKTYPGVTDILKVLDKSGPLMAWAARQTAEAALSALDALPGLLASVGPEGVIKALTSRSAWSNEKARDLGTRIHGYADDLIHGRALEGMTAPEEQRIVGYAAWWEASGWTLRASEAYIVNTAVGYGGTLDLLCYDRDGRTVLADIKSGNIDYRGRIYDSIVLQLVAYGAGEWLDKLDGTLYAMPAVDRYAVIHVRADGTSEVEVSVDTRDVLAFGACVLLSDWSRGRKAPEGEPK